MPALTLAQYQCPILRLKKYCYSPCLLPVPLGRAEQLPTNIARKAARMFIIGPNQRGRAELLVNPASNQFFESGGIITPSRISSFLKLEL
jgi:hypothetical protein